MESGDQSLSQLINSQPSEMYGSAEVSLAETKALKELYLSLRENTFGSKKDLSNEERSQLKDLVRLSVIDDGWPELKNLGLTDLAETATAHACVVAEKLYEERGEAATPDTIWSYTTKNQFDRFVKNTLVRSGKLNKDSAMRQDWDSTKDRSTPREPGRVKYPKNLDDTKIYGVAKVERYWPAQLMRYLEAVRLGKATSSDLEKLRVENADPEIYKIPWNTFQTVIEEANSVEDIAVNVAVKTLEILKERGLKNEQLTALLLTGYSPGGPTNEHGNIEEIGKIWRGILENVKSNQNISGLYNNLSDTINKKFVDVDYPFNITPALNR